MMLHLSSSSTFELTYVCINVPILREARRSLLEDPVFRKLSHLKSRCPDSEDNEHRTLPAIIDVGGRNATLQAASARIRTRARNHQGCRQKIQGASSYCSGGAQERRAAETKSDAKRATENGAGRSVHRRHPEKRLKGAFNQRHTAHQIWERLQIEIPGCDIGESTVRAYVRVRKAELDVAGQDVFSDRSSLDDEVLHSDVPLRVIEREFPSGTASNLVGLIKGGRLRERKKALAVLGSLKGIRTAVIARCLQMSRKTVRALLQPLCERRPQCTVTDEDGQAER